VRDPDWLEPTDDEIDAHGPRRARPLLLALASVPWLVVIALLVVPGRLGVEDPEPTAGTAPGAGSDAAHVTDPSVGEAARMDHAGTDAAPPPSTDPGPGAEPQIPDHPDEAVTLEARELRGHWRVEAGAEEAVALAVVAGRAWLTGVAPVLDLGYHPEEAPDAAGRYAEHLVVEAVEQPAADAVVVTLVAVVLDATGGAAPTVRRLGVPVALTDQGPRLAGSPWELLPPVLDRVELVREPITAAAELDAARAALVTAGLTGLDLLALHRTDGWPVIAEVTTPGAGTTKELWLRRHLDGFVVAGTTLTGPGSVGAPSDPATPALPEGHPLADPGTDSEPEADSAPEADSDPEADPDPDIDPGSGPEPTETRP
jgi:hypothetical protein